MNGKIFRSSIFVSLVNDRLKLQFKFQFVVAVYQLDFCPAGCEWGGTICLQPVYSHQQWDRPVP